MGALLVCLGEVGLRSLPPFHLGAAFAVSAAAYHGLDSVFAVLCFSGEKQVELMITGL